MTKLVVEENVPRPKSVPELLGDLKPGQSVLIPPDMLETDSVRTTVWRVGKKYPERNYTTGQEEGGVRVWRNADKAEGETPKDE